MKDSEGRVIAEEGAIYHFQLGDRVEEFVDMLLRRSFADGRLQIEIIGGGAIDISPQGRNAIDIRMRWSDGLG